MGGARFVYNAAVEHVRKTGVANRSELRQKFAAANAPLVKQNDWLAAVPYKIREQATDDVVKAQQSNKAKRENDPKHRTWTLKFRNRRDASAWTAGIVSRMFHCAEVVDRPTERRPRRDGQPHPQTNVRKWTRLLINRADTKTARNELGYFHAVEALPEQVLSGKTGHLAIKHDCRLTLDQLGRFYLCVPVPFENAEVRKPLAERKVVALDPGVRAFQTYYSEEEHGAYAEGAEGFGRIYSYCEQLDQTIALQAQRPTTPFVQRMLRDRVWRIRQRVRNLVDEVHKKVALDLTSRFDTILIPDFKTKQMAQRKDREDNRPRTIRSKTARAMLTWAHYRFRTRLQHKALEMGAEVATITEEYTSKTCGCCGFINKKFSSKTFCCSECGATADRDAHAARNIFLKHIASPAA